MDHEVPLSDTVRVRDLVREICSENQVEIIRGVVSKLIQHLKGKTSRKIQQEFPELSKEVLGKALVGNKLFCQD